jgi:hypothetical protein
MLAVTNNMNRSTAGRRGEELKSEEDEDSACVIFRYGQERTRAQGGVGGGFKV